jgi:diaminopimelate epimerase
MIKFCKLHGFGNDYIVIEAEYLNDVSTVHELAKTICHRNLGVGSDGIALLEKLDGVSADYNCRIINPDGSEASFSGNGTRCAVAYLHHKNLWNAENLRLQTSSGLKNYQLLKRDGTTFWFNAEIGKPSAIEVLKLTINNSQFTINSVDVGNPVAVILVESFDLDWREIGKQIESHEKFLNKTNVVFVKVTDLQNIEIRIWERGAGETSSSGTCSTAAAIVHLFYAKSRGLVHVHAEGGTTEIEWRDNDKMLIKGRADLVCEGEYFNENV